MIFILIDVAKFPSRSLNQFSFSQQEWECLFPHPLLPRSHQSSEFCPLKSENQFKMCISFIMKDAIDTFKEDYQWPVGLFFCVVCFGFGFVSCTRFPAPHWVVVFLLIYRNFWYIKSARPLSYKLQIFFPSLFEDFWGYLQYFLKFWKFDFSIQMNPFFTFSLQSWCLAEKGCLHSIVIKCLPHSFLVFFYEFIFSVEILVPSGICLDVKSEDKIQFYFFSQMAS